MNQEMSKQYWEKRQHEREAKAYTSILEVEKEYKEALERAKLNINKQISHIGAKYMKDNNLSYAEAVKQLKGAEYKLWRKDLHEYMQEWKALEKSVPLEAKKLWLEIETLAGRSRISHLDALRAQIDVELSKVSTVAVESTRKALYGVYGNTYKGVVGDLGIRSMFSTSMAKAVIDRPWSGANYSSRLWGNSERLAKTLKQEIVTGMIQGINLKTMNKQLSDKIDGAKKNDVERLLRTEVNYTMNQATLDGYKEARVEKYTFDATLDSRTSQICSELNAETFEVSKAAVGVNYPPIHPRCRSTTTPIIDFEALGEKLREEKELQENGKNGIIDLEIDEMTPCLRRLSDNEIVQTTVKEITYDEGDFRNWLFDWSETEKNGYQILALYADGDDRIQGAVAIKHKKWSKSIEIDIAEAAPFNSSYNKKIAGKEYNGVGAHLFAEACKRSFDAGYEGYVEFMAKTKLIEYYENKMGATLISRQRMVIESKAAVNLINKYYGGDGI